jgi:hypothetical protein
MVRQHKSCDRLIRGQSDGIEIKQLRLKGMEGSGPASTSPFIRESLVAALDRLYRFLAGGGSG